MERKQFVDYTVFLPTENPKESTKKLLGEMSLLAKLQDTRSEEKQLYLYTITINILKMKLFSQFHLKWYQENEILRYKFNRCANLYPKK